ncbi:hypothetical protein [Desulfosporosinus shakirovi]|uniref:hypothetical protein n=1 Tax=Desulfosporosinus shakirovi TaxID=2885154 RepID=UPI001E43D1EE|nr:hypothetical protein [Desulfosporosinus sp. SRJS8]MCB8817835.1 hypothetical protein [Desulfosporosinus sp. SRJS8]
MLRNKEIKLYMTLLTVVVIVGFVACYFFNPVSGIIALLALLLMAAVSFLFTRWKYQQIEKLADYLKRIADGEYSLDIRDNDEGELSILKSELYKVTVTLSEQADLLKNKTPITSMSVMTDLISDENLPPVWARRSQSWLVGRQSRRKAPQNGTI